MSSYDRFKACLQPSLSKTGFCPPAHVAQALGCSRQRVHQIMQTDEFKREFDYLNKKVIVPKGHVPDLTAVRVTIAESNHTHYRHQLLIKMILGVTFPDYPVTSEWISSHLPEGHGYSSGSIMRAVRAIAKSGQLRMLKGPNRHGYIMSNEAWELRLNGNIDIRNNADVIRVYLGAYRRSGGDFHAYEVQKATGINIGVVYNVIRQLMKMGEVECVGPSWSGGHRKIIYRFVSAPSQGYASSDSPEPDHR